MKDQILKIAKVKSEKEFYKKYPTEEAFMKAHGKELKKAAMGTAMVKQQLEQLTDFGNPPVAQYGIAFKPLSYEDALTNSRAMNTGRTKDQYIADRALGKVEDEPTPKEPDGIGNFISMGMDIAGQFMEGGEGDDGGGLKAPSSVTNAAGEYGTGVDTRFGSLIGFKNGGYIAIPEAQFGAIAGALKGIGAKSGGIGNLLGDVIGGKGTSKGIMDAMGPNGLLGKGGPGLKSLATKGGLGAAGKAAGLGLLNSAGDILGGVGQMKEQKNQIAKADQAAQVSGLVKQATASNPVEIQKGNYARPEDNLVQPGQLNAPQGTGTNFLQMRAGGEIQNTYAPGTLYDDLGYEPLKQYRQGGDIPEAGFGDYFQSSGQASIGKGVGSALGNVFGGPLGGMIGGALGTVAGNLLGGKKDADKLAGLQAQTQRNTMETAGAQMLSGIRGNFGSFMEQGGYVSNDWQPQVITKFGEYDVKDLLKPDPTMDTLRSGGHLAQVGYTAPSAEGLQTYAMGGNLKTHWGGGAELMSYNPYIPGGGETVMFRGQSHDDTNSKGQSGIGITYGDSPVEVERGEPMTEMNDGGVVFGNMKIDEFAAEQINDPKAKGMKYKNYVADLSKTEAKQNKIMDKASKLALDKNVNNAFDQLSLNASEASMIGANMKLKDIAKKKLDAAAVQNAILQTAEERGLESDALSQGKIKEAKFGANVIGQSGFNTKGMRNVTDKKKTTTSSSSSKSKSSKKDNVKLYDIDKTKPYFTDYDLPSGFTPGVTALGDNTGGLKQGVIATINQNLGFTKPKENVDVPFKPGYTLPAVMSEYDKNGNYFDAQGNLVDQSGDLPGVFSADQIAKGKGEGWKDVATALMQGVMPLLRPTDQEPLDPSQLYPEMMALASNQLEPVQAQQFTPLLQGAPADISLQDQLNEITAQARSAERMSQYNPEAAAAIFANVSQAKNKVLAEQFRMNQARKEQVYAENRQALNQAQLKNLQILDNQYVNQAKAKSATKAQALEAMKSIADKTAKNKLENRQLGIYENLYNYRFDPMGRAFSFNDPYQFNVPDVGASQKTKDTKGDDLLPVYNKKGEITGYKVKESKNGSIVKAIKNL